jgi:hypothetical protein
LLIVVVPFVVLSDYFFCYLQTLLIASLLFLVRWYTNILPQPVLGHIMVHAFNRPIGNKPTNSRGTETKHRMWADVRLVSLFDYLAHVWTVKDEWIEWKVIWLDPMDILLDISVSPRKKLKKKIKQTSNYN